MAAAGWILLLSVFTVINAKSALSGPGTLSGATTDLTSTVSMEAEKAPALSAAGKELTSTMPIQAGAEGVVGAVAGAAVKGVEPEPVLSNVGAAAKKPGTTAEKEYSRLAESKATKPETTVEKAYSALAELKPSCPPNEEPCQPPCPCQQQPCPPCPKPPCPTCPESPDTCLCPNPPCPCQQQPCPPCPNPPCPCEQQPCPPCPKPPCPCQPCRPIKPKKCSSRYIKMGCYKHPSSSYQNLAWITPGIAPKKMPDWKTFLSTLVCQCSKTAKRRGFRFFGVKYFKPESASFFRGACFTAAKPNMYLLQGDTTLCVDQNQETCDLDDKSDCTGKANSIFCYKRTVKEDDEEEGSEDPGYGGGRLQVAQGRTDWKTSWPARYGGVTMDLGMVGDSRGKINHNTDGTGQEASEAKLLQRLQNM